jgi:hypothetical protein
MNPRPTPPQSSPVAKRVGRARSLPSSRPFNVAAFFSSIHYLTLVATLTGVVILFLNRSSGQSDMAVKVVVGGLALSLITWLIAFFKRRAASCPLCKGTPLLNSGALPHSRATRIFPLNHGVSAVISIMFTQKFRCMYCGTDFDLLKTSSHRRKPQPDGGTNF